MDGHVNNDQSHDGQDKITFGPLNSFRGTIIVSLAGSLGRAELTANLGRIGGLSLSSEPQSSLRFKN